MMQAPTPPRREGYSAPSKNSGGVGGWGLQRIIVNEGSMSTLVIIKIVGVCGGLGGGRIIEYYLLWCD